MAKVSPQGSSSTTTKAKKVTGNSLDFPLATPQWVVDTLKTQSAADQLDDIPPEILAALSVSQHEYGTTGSATGIGTGGPTWVNATGYGGYFGLGATVPYPGGTATRELLETASIESFREQATIASSDIEELLKEYTETYRKVFNVLQTGKPTGTSETEQELTSVFGGHVGEYRGSTGQIKTSHTGTNTVKLPGVGGILQELTKFLNPTTWPTEKSGGTFGGLEGTVKTVVSRGLLGAVFVAMAVIGVYVVAKGPASSVIQLGQAQRRSILAGQRIAVSQQHEATSAAREQRLSLRQGLGT